jgi:hypothetical protein
VARLAVVEPPGQGRDIEGCRSDLGGSDQSPAGGRAAAGMIPCLSFKEQMMSSLTNNDHDFAANFLARLEQARANRRWNQTSGTQRVQQLRQDLGHLAYDGDENVPRPLHAGQVLTRMLGCLEDRDYADPEVNYVRDMVLTALLEHGRKTFDEYYGSDLLAFRRDPLRAQLDEIRATLEQAVVQNDLGGVTLALAMLDHVDGDPGHQGAESSAPAQPAV